jgi:hypothetical protein
MTGTRQVNHIEIVLFDQPIRVHVEQAKTGIGTPMPQQPLSGDRPGHRGPAQIFSVVFLSGRHWQPLHSGDARFYRLIRWRKTGRKTGMGTAER